MKSFTTYAWGYGAALLAFGILDGLWLGLVARDFYRSQMSAVIATDFNMVAAASFYVLYPLGVLFVALTPTPTSWSEALIRSALLGLVAYGVYDLTNMATLKAWPLKLALTDMVWGTLMTGVAGLAAYSAMAWSMGSKSGA